MTEPVVITELERSSAVWQKLKPYYEARLASLRAKNDGNLTPEQTQRLRGQIAEVRGILSLGTDKPQVPNEAELFKD